MDVSASINEYRVNAFKSMMEDIVRSLPVGEHEMHIGLVTYSSTATAEFALTDSYDTNEIINAIWRAEYRGGSSCAANGMAAARDMFAYSGTTGFEPVTIFLTDGPDIIAATLAMDISNDLRRSVVMYVIRKCAIIS